MEELLKETYGISVYQEQVMLLSQKLAASARATQDVLRKAMGKKDRATLDKMKGRLPGRAPPRRDSDPEGLRKVWTDWEAFRAIRLQQIAQHLLRLRGLPDGRG
jgi:DNA polymerase-3 subunit alpha